MPGIASTRCVDPERLSEGARRAFTESLYRVHTTVFDGVDYDEFRKYVVESKAESTEILLLENAEGVVVGYVALHVFEKALGGRTCAVVRAEAGMERKYRGGAAPVGFGLRRILAYKARHPSRPLYYLGCLVHPSSYSLFARWSANRLWPNHAAAVPDDVHRFMDELGDLFGLERVDPENSLVRAVGWQTRDTEVETNYWRACPKPAVQCFVRLNPHYGAGHGLLTLVPITAPALAGAARRFLEERYRPRLEALRTRVLGEHPEPIRPAQILAALRTTPLFGPLAEWDLEHLARLMEVRRFRSGELVIRAGEPGDALYVVLSGAAYIVLERDGEEHLLDDMEPGDAFGEMALLTGAPRSATVRAAGALTVLRLGRDPFGKLLAARTDLRAAIWDAYVRRALRSHLVGVPPFARLRFDARQRLIDATTRIDVAAGTHRPLPDGDYAFVALGAVEIEQPGRERTRAAAPALVPIAAPSRVSSVDGAVVTVLPSPGAPGLAAEPAAPRA